MVLVIIGVSIRRLFLRRFTSETLDIKRWRNEVTTETLFLERSARYVPF